MSEPSDLLKRFDRKEVTLPDTVFIRDIETRLFQSMVLECLSRIQGISPIEGGLIDSLLRKEGAEKLKGISVQQDSKDQAVQIRVEVNAYYGVVLPAKAEEIQMKIVQEVSRLTGLHVGVVHVVFKDLMSPKALECSPARSSATCSES